MTAVLPAASAGAIFQRQLQERVVPRPDQPAHADRLVDDPADGRRARSCRRAGPPPCRRGPRSSGRRGRRRRCPQRLSRIALPVLSVSSRASSSRSRSSRSATRSSRAARSPVGRRGQSVSSNARRAAAMAAWTWSSVATSTSVTSEASVGLMTGLHVPSPDATHSPSMNRLGTVPSLGSTAGPLRVRGRPRAASRAGAALRAVRRTGILIRPRRAPARHGEEHRRRVLHERAPGAGERRRHRRRNRRQQHGLPPRQGWAGGTSCCSRRARSRTPAAPPVTPRTSSS